MNASDLTPACPLPRTTEDDLREREMHEGAQAEREAEQGAEPAKRSDGDDGGNA